VRAMANALDRIPKPVAAEASSEGEPVETSEAEFPHASDEGAEDAAAGEAARRAAAAAHTEKH
ncbi:MAG: hypothetical protein WBC67_04890, partial [Candidatus Acidiferrales bacterium]